MKIGVPAQHRSRRSDPLALLRRPLRTRPVGRGSAIALLATLLCLAFTASALAASASVGLGSAASFSVLAGSTVTNTGPTTMFGSLGLSPGSSVTGAPQVLGQTHIDDAVAIGAKNDLTSAYNDAASRPSNGSAGTDLAGQTFLPGVRVASGALLLSSGAVTLDAQGNPNAVFIFQVGSTLITASNTSVVLINGAQACNVFWEVGSSATLGTGTSFVGTIMASTTITANTAATIHGRLLAGTGAVNLESNTITTSNCASSESGEGGGTETAGPVTPAAASAPAAATAPVATAPAVKGKAPVPSAKAKKAKRKRKHHRRITTHPRPARPHHTGGFTG
jgi:Ice-binding-like